MGRTTTRTELTTIQLRIQLEDYLKAEDTTLAGFKARYLPHMSYSTFSNAMKGDYSTEEVIAAINEAFDEALRDQLRRDRKTCPHCKAALD